ncbi:MAG: DsrE family protein [Anaerolineae bacterium]
MKESKKGKIFLVLLTSGPEAPGKVRAALMFAALAASFYLETVIYCVQDGARVMVKGAVDSEVVKPGRPSMRSRMREAIEAGVRFEVCSETANGMEISQADLIPEASIVGGARLIDYALLCEGMLTF